MDATVVVEKTMDYAVRIVRMYQYLCKEKKEYFMSKQLLRCGTSIGANVAEAPRGQSKADFRAKMSIKKGGISMTPEQLIGLAKEAMTHAYVPYSGYKVGAALLCADGTVYQGCNIENASYSPTVCAERVAFFKAVYDGHRDFTAIAVCGGKDGVITSLFPPCGVCRQVMREFCEDDFLVYLAGPDGFETRTLAQILPDSFSAKKHMQE